MKMLKISTLIATVALALSCLSPVLASEGAKLDKAPDVHHDQAALQRGAKTFINYCLNCHSAKAVRYNTLTQLGFSEEDIKNNLLFTGNGIGDLMETSLRHDDAKRWFGVVPPDLSLATRARAGLGGSGEDWVYTYLRAFYQDGKSATGWNNRVFPNVAMPHVLWEQQGTQTLENGHELKLTNPGLLSPDDYNQQTAELVGFMSWMAEPYRADRQFLGIFVLLFFAVMSVLAYRLKKEYWKDVR